MARLRLMTAAGDHSAAWDPAGVEAGDPEALAAVREAERIFEAARAAGGIAFKVADGKSERLDRFDPLAEEIIVVPRLAGG